MKEADTIVSPKQAEEIAAESENPFSSKTALRVFERIGRATQASRGEAIEFQVTGRTRSLSELITPADRAHMKAALEAEGWKLRLVFVEGEQDPGHHSPGWQNILDVRLKPITEDAAQE